MDLRGDLMFDTLPVGQLPPELDGMKELQGREILVVPGSMMIVDSVMRRTIKHKSGTRAVVVQGPVRSSEPGLSGWWICLGRSSFSR